MGLALARAAQKKAHVIVVCGPATVSFPRGVRHVPVVSADEMFGKVKEYLPRADVFISAAAVADYRVKKRQRHKMKKSAAALSLELVPTVDILAWAGKRKGKQVLVGFALESKDLLAAARRKREQKNLDLIVANAPAAIGSSSARCWFIGTDGRARALGARTKDRIAEMIIHEALRLREIRKTA
jgi:phosphopantothenoylcysteine decarboxylase/phosphopantothenate--cysteine ligase